MSSNHILSATLEDYLETILHLVAENKVARVKDIADSLDVHKSSVTGALRSLAERGLVNYEPYGLTTLTPEGAKLARGVAERHSVLKQFLTDVLGVDEATADKAACKMEHAVGRTIVERLVQLSEFFGTSSCGAEWTDTWKAYCRKTRGTHIPRRAGKGTRAEKTGKKGARP